MRIFKKKEKRTSGPCVVCHRPGIYVIVGTINYAYMIEARCKRHANVCTTMFGYDAPHNRPSKEDNDKILKDMGLY